MAAKKGVYHKIIWLVLAITALVSLIGLGGNKFWELDLVNHFRPQLFFVSTFLLLCAFFIRSRKLQVLSVLLILFNLSFVYPAFNLSQKLPNNKSLKPQYLFLSANLFVYNEDHQSILKLIDEVNPDVIWLMEVNDQWFKDLHAYLQDQYRYHIERTRPDSYGIALFSRYPFEADIQFFEDSKLPYVDVMLNNEDIRFIGIHASSPINEKRIAYKNIQMKKITELVKDETKPVVVMGDFNDTPWTNTFQRLLKESRLRNAAEGCGFFYTWPNFFFPAGIQIDHALIKNIPTGYFKTHHSIGSDHYPISFQVVE